MPFTPGLKGASDRSRRGVALGRCVLAVALLALAAAGPPAAADDETPRATVPLDRIPRRTVAPDATPTMRGATDELCAEARRRCEAGQYVEALAVLNQALERHGPDAALLMLVARARQGLGHWGEARSAAEHAALLQPNDAGVLLFLGRLYRTRDRQEDALAYLHAAAEAPGNDPNDARPVVALLELGQTLQRAGYLLAAAEAYARFDERIERQPGLREAGELVDVVGTRPHGLIEERLGLLAELGRTPERIEAARAAAAAHPDDAYLARLHLRTLLEAGRAAAALAYGRARIEDLAPGRAGGAEGPAGGVAPALLEITVEAAQAAGALSDWADDVARRLALKVPADAQADSVIAACIADAMSGVGAHGEAARIWQAVAESRPDAPDVAWARASALRAAGDPRGALDALIAFVRAHPERLDVPHDRFRAWIEGYAVPGDLAERIERRSAGGDFATFAVLGCAAAAGGEDALADRLFRAAQDARPESAALHVLRGRLRLAQYRWEAALEAADAALALDPTLASAHFVRGEALAALDRHEAAEAAYRAAVEHAPGEVEYLLALGELARRMNNLLAAQRYFQQAWTRAPGHGRAVEELIDSYLSGGKVEVAQMVVEQARQTPLPEGVLRRVRTAVRFASQAMSDAHLDELARQFAAHPDDVRTGLTLAAGYYWRDRIDAAYDVLRRVEPRLTNANDPSHALRERLLTLLAPVHVKRLEYEEAISLLETLTQRHPNRQYLLRLLANAYFADFRVDEAREVLRRIVALDLTPEERARTRAHLVDTYALFGEFEPALSLVDQWIAEDPNQTALVWAKAELLAAAEREEEALELVAERLDRITANIAAYADELNELTGRVQRDPEDATARRDFTALDEKLRPQLAKLEQARSAYVRTAAAAERYGPALERLRSWIGENPDDNMARQWLVELLLADQQAEAALKVMEEYRPQTAEQFLIAVQLQARCQAALGQLDKAVADLQEVLGQPFVEREPAARLLVQHEIVRLLTEAEAYDRALQLCGQWLAAAAAPARELEVLTLKRFVLQAAGHEDEIIEVSERMLELDPHDPGLNNDLGYTWADRGEQLRRALEMIRTAVAADPQNAAYLDSLGWAYYKLGDFDSARKYLSRAVRLHAGRDPVVYDHVGDMFYRQGDADAARRHWETARALLEAADTPLAGGVDRAATLGRIRAKLEALQRGEEPDVAPTGVEAPDDTPHREPPRGFEEIS